MRTRPNIVKFAPLRFGREKSAGKFIVGGELVSYRFHTAGWLDSSNKQKSNKTRGEQVDQNRGDEEDRAVIVGETEVRRERVWGARLP